MNRSNLFSITLWRQRLQQLGGYARRAAPFGSGVLAALAALLLYNFFAPVPQPLTATQVGETVALALAEATPPPPYAALAFHAIQPSLVVVEVQIPREKGEEKGGFGSGVVINDQGDILTSLHVVTNAIGIQITFADGTESSAEIVAAMPESDIAVLHPKELPKLLVPAVLGSPGALSVGDEAFVVGHPLGLYASMSAGVISGFDRSFTPTDSDQKLSGLIQIDAAVNPGNSGGPLLNRYGEVVGIVAGLVNPTDENFFVGIGFAVPINVAGGGAGLPPY